MTAAPGCEEEIIDGIQSLFGFEVPIIGGSSADEQIQGAWRQVANDRVESDSVVLTTMFPSVETVFAFHSGHEPTDSRGTVTRASGRVLYEIDGRPAAEVYEEWIGRDLNAQDGGAILSQTTTVPFGRLVGAIGGVDSFVLVHPATISEDGAIRTFAELRAGDTLVLMRGTRRSLVTRAGRVVHLSLHDVEGGATGISGAIVFFCAGCYLTVGDAMGDVVKGVRSALDGRPFLGAFTYGEQGCLPDGQNHHGNLMISVLGWTRE